MLHVAWRCLRAQAKRGAVLASMIGQSPLKAKAAIPSSALSAARPASASILHTSYDAARPLMDLAAAEGLASSPAPHQQPSPLGAASTTAAHRMSSSLSGTPAAAAANSTAPAAAGGSTGLPLVPTMRRMSLSGTGAAYCSGNPSPTNPNSLVPSDAEALSQLFGGRPTSAAVAGRVVPAQRTVALADAGATAAAAQAAAARGPGAASGAGASGPGQGALTPRGLSSAGGQPAGAEQGGEAPAAGEGDQQMQGEGQEGGEEEEQEQEGEEGEGEQQPADTETFVGLDGLVITTTYHTRAKTKVTRVRTWQGSGDLARAAFLLIEVLTLMHGLVHAVHACRWAAAPPASQPWRWPTPGTVRWRRRGRQGVAWGQRGAHGPARPPGAADRRLASPRCGALVARPVVQQQASVWACVHNVTRALGLPGDAGCA